MWAEVLSKVDKIKKARSCLRKIQEIKTLRWTLNSSGINLNQYVIHPQVVSFYFKIFFMSKVALIPYNNEIFWFIIRWICIS